MFILRSFLSDNWYDLLDLFKAEFCGLFLQALYTAMDFLIRILCKHLSLATDTEPCWNSLFGLRFFSEIHVPKICHLWTKRSDKNCGKPYHVSVSARIISYHLTSSDKSSDQIRFTALLRKLGSIVTSVWLPTLSWMVGTVFLCFLCFLLGKTNPPRGHSKGKTLQMQWSIAVQKLLLTNMKQA